MLFHLVGLCWSGGLSVRGHGACGLGFRPEGRVLVGVCFQLDVRVVAGLSLQSGIRIVPGLSFQSGVSLTILAVRHQVQSLLQGAYQ